MESPILDHSRVPLSMPGSLLGVSAETRVDARRYFVRSLHRFADPRDVLGIGMGGQTRVESVRLSPGRVALGWSCGLVEAAFSGCDSLRLRASGGGCKLDINPMAARAESHDARTVVVLLHESDLALRLTGLNCDLRLESEHIVLASTSGPAEVVLEEVDGKPDPGGGFDQHVRTRQDEFAEWLSRFESRYPKANPTALAEAAYLLWCCQAGPKGALRRRAVYMSKNWMTGIWSWDNCFNAIALAEIDPALAWDQFLFFFDHQNAEGRVPDLITASGADWGMTKPPVYGWTLSKLRAAHPFFRDTERWMEAYEPMVRQANFWLETRDGDGDGLPEYHHGCDSGWDNGTAFLDCLPCASPDLAAWLILQLEELAWLATMIGRPEEATRWTKEADSLAGAMSAHCWDGRRWLAVQSHSHLPSPGGDSLLPWLAGMAGHRMSDTQRVAVVNALSEEGRFLTPFGPATESVKSPLYEADGYWRGPIWGPSTVMAVEACRACGAPGLASDIARRFLNMGNQFGFAENHDALTGRGLRDPGYTWTAAAWCILQKESPLR